MNIMLGMFVHVYVQKRKSYFLATAYMLQIAVVEYSCGLSVFCILHISARATVYQYSWNHSAHCWHDDSQQGLL
jgi:hypothetical protein